MCYMSDRDELARVGVRELRQNLSVYLRRVKAGETLQVTEQGIPVGLLAPLPRRPPTRLEELVGSGQASAASVMLAELPLPPKPKGRPLSSVLRKMRDEDQV